MKSFSIQLLNEYQRPVIKLYIYSEKNQKYLRESIREFNEGKVVSFSDEEWEKFINVA